MNSPPINNELINRLRKKMARASASNTPVLDDDENVETNDDLEKDADLKENQEQETNTNK